MRLLPRLFPMDKQAGASFRECTWMNLVLILFCTALKVDGANFCWHCYRWLGANFRHTVGPCMDLSMHVPNGYLTVVFDRLPVDANTAYVLESRLISMDGATQIPISGFEASRWHNS